ncbi:GAF domain-containing protein, partial [Salmonella enterica]|uniref:GAF domain-containing protein n=1 Tax=Salmonella enterica TaxID=28901 RepID=UPI002FE2D49B
MERLLDRLVDEEAADFGSLQIWDADAACLRLIAHRGFDRASVNRFATVRDGDGTICEEAKAGRPVFVSDIDEADHYSVIRDWARGTGIRSIRSTPIMTDDGALVG